MPFTLLVREEMSADPKQTFFDSVVVAGHTP